MRSYTANRRELRFGVVAAEAAAGCLIVMAPGVCVRSMEALIRAAQSNRLSYCQCCDLSTREMGILLVLLCLYIQPTSLAKPMLPKTYPRFFEPYCPADGLAYPSINRLHQS